MVRKGEDEIMDTTKEYIKQSDCPEIQKQFGCALGDWVYVKKTINYNVENPFCVGHEFKTFDSLKGRYRVHCGWDECDYLRRGDFTWLPTQDRLQEMFDNTEYSTFRNYFFFHDWIEDNILDGDYIPRQKYKDWSMEQLWLAFVMWKNYDKVWVNHKWVKQAKENLQEGGKPNGRSKRETH